MYILGISAFYHDSAACLIKDGEIIAAAQEERFTRQKHDPSFPSNAILFCLQQSGITHAQLDSIAFYEKPFLKFERLLETYLAFAPKGFQSFSKAMPLWVKDKLFQKITLMNALDDTFDIKGIGEEKLLFSEHHLSHAASAFYPSPFKNAAILTMDGVGEWATTSLAIGAEHIIRVEKEISFPHSLGLLYSAFTSYTGFRVNSGEYKLMGLAPYGEPKYTDTIKDNLINIKDDGSFHLNMDYFNYCTGLTMTNNKFHSLFAGEPRELESEIGQKEMDLAASIQKVTEEVIIKLGKNISKTTGQENLCLAGGVALNCVANGALLRENIFQDIWIQPAAGDAGGALGAALSIHHLMKGKPRSPDKKKDSMKGSYLGPEFSNEAIEKALNKLGASFKRLGDEEIIASTAYSLSKGMAIGWMQGRMEFGPRALGARSIIADPRSSKMQKQLNLKVKYRESFRPFAPSILSEHVSDWFELNENSPYMLIVAKILESKRYSMTEKQNLLFGIDKLNAQRSQVPAVTHIDYSARIQTVHHDTNPKYHQLLTRFFEITECPILVNTSFNVRGEPIVCTPEDAFKCFMGTELDCLVIGNYFLEKNTQNIALEENYKDKYKLD
ncbi:carbamoyltransferase [bacterium]|nr:carbamoyltransferase [bacterium]